MADERLGNLERKVDRILRFIAKVEAAFAPAAAPTPAEAEKVEDAIRGLAGEMPPDEDMLEWSTPGALPSERKAEQDKERGQ